MSTSEQTYQIEINDTQRKLIVRGLHELPLGALSLENQEIVRRLQCHFEGLPVEETGQTWECAPGERRRMLHGFCL